MLVHRLIALTLASLAGGCTGYRCDPMEGMFSVDEALNEGDIQRILQEYAVEDRGAIDWVIASIDECTMSLTPTQATLGHALRELPELARRQACDSPPELAMPVGIASSLAERFAAGLAAAA